METPVELHIRVFCWAFLFDGVGMNHVFAAVAPLSIASLLLASGCASSQTRTQANGSVSPSVSQSVGQTYAPSPSQQTSAIYASDHANDELVIGTAFENNDAIPHYHAPITDYTLSEIQAELEAMHDLDRQLVGDSLSINPNDQATASMIRTIDRVHADRLKEIVNHIGWPTRELVGLKATQAAYMVIQHAGHDNEFQNRCLALMVDLVKEGELPASYVALLTDRIRVFQNQPQVFGTQMSMAPNEHGVLVPTPTVPIEDPEHLDDRRKLMGMPPHRDFVSAIAVAYEAMRDDAGSAYATVPTSD